MANFFSRPDLSDIQFKQLDNSELHLSGFTHITKPGGLLIADGSGNTIPIVATGATSGHVLTYLDGQIKLAPGGAASDILFDSNRSTTRSGIPNVNIGGGTVNEFLEGYFFPAVPPTSSLSATNNAREFGDSATGTLSYSIVRNTNPLNASSLDSTGDGVCNKVIISSEVPGSCSGSFTYTFPSNCALPSGPGASQASVGYGMCSSTINSEVTTASANVSWKNRKYYFTNNTLYNTTDQSTLQTIAQGLSGSQASLATSRNANLTLTFNNEFFYYMYPKSFGEASYAVNGLPNNAWGSTSIGTLFEVSYTNNFGYTNNYYVARSDNRITGTFTIAIT